jgi:hypothetical protein
MGMPHEGVKDAAKYENTHGIARIRRLSGRYGKAGVWQW